MKNLFLSGIVNRLHEPEHISNTAMYALCIQNWCEFLSIGYK